MLTTLKALVEAEVEVSEQSITNLVDTIKVQLDTDSVEGSYPQVLKIVCDDTNNTPEDLKANRLNVHVYPACSAESIKINFTI